MQQFLPPVPWHLTVKIHVFITCRHLCIHSSEMDIRQLPELLWRQVSHCWGQSVNLWKEPSMPVRRDYHMCISIVEVVGMSLGRRTGKERESKIENKRVYWLCGHYSWVDIQTVVLLWSCSRSIASHFTPSAQPLVIYYVSRDTRMYCKTSDIDIVALF